MFGDKFKCEADLEVLHAQRETVFPDMQAFVKLVKEMNRVHGDEIYVHKTTEKYLKIICVVKNCTFQVWF